MAAPTGVTGPCCSASPSLSDVQRLYVYVLCMSRMSPCDQPDPSEEKKTAHTQWLHCKLQETALTFFLESSAKNDVVMVYKTLLIPPSTHRDLMTHNFKKQNVKKSIPFSRPLCVFPPRETHEQRWPDLILSHRPSVSLSHAVFKSQPLVFPPSSAPTTEVLTRTC